MIKDSLKYLNILNKNKYNISPLNSHQVQNSQKTLNNNLSQSFKKGNYNNLIHKPSYQFSLRKKSKTISLNLKWPFRITLICKESMLKKRLMETFQKIINQNSINFNLQQIKDEEIYNKYKEQLNNYPQKYNQYAYLFQEDLINQKIEQLNSETSFQQKLHFNDISFLEMNFQNERLMEEKYLNKYEFSLLQDLINKAQLNVPKTDVYIYINYSDNDILSLTKNNYEEDEHIQIIRKQYLQSLDSKYEQLIFLLKKSNQVVLELTNPNSTEFESFRFIMKTLSNFVPEIQKLNLFKDAHQLLQLINIYKWDYQKIYKDRCIIPISDLT